MYVQAAILGHSNGLNLLIYTSKGSNTEALEPSFCDDTIASQTNANQSDRVYSVCDVIVSSQPDELELNFRMFLASSL